MRFNSPQDNGFCLSKVSRLEDLRVSTKSQGPETETEVRSGPYFEIHNSASTIRTSNSLG
jgi:hypothetical protein